MADRGKPEIVKNGFKDAGITDVLEPKSIYCKYTIVYNYIKQLKSVHDVKVIFKFLGWQFLVTSCSSFVRSGLALLSLIFLFNSLPHKM